MTHVSYDAFISYSHAADGRLAPALQDGLQRFAKRWNARRSLRVFRDDTGLSVNAALWPSIEAALDGSRFFILLASPRAAGSEWVDREVSRWIALGHRDSILPVVTDGEWTWDPAENDFDWERSSAVPRSLRGAFAEEPRHLDLRWAHADTDPQKLDLRNSEFRSAIADLAAPIHGVPKDELEGRDLREHRTARRLRRIATTALVILAIALGIAAVTAVRNAQEARRQEQLATTQAQRATSRQLAAQSVALASSQLDVSLLLGLSARAVEDSANARGALLTSLEANPNLVAYVRAKDGDASAVAASNDLLFAVGDSSGAVQVLDFDRLSEVARVELPEGERVTRLAFSEAEDQLAIGTQSGDVLVWDRRSGGGLIQMTGGSRDGARGIARIRRSKQTACRVVDARRDR